MQHVSDLAEIYDDAAWHDAAVDRVRKSNCRWHKHAQDAQDIAVVAMVADGLAWRRNRS